MRIYEWMPWDVKKVEMGSRDQVVDSMMRWLTVEIKHVRQVVQDQWSP